MFKFLFFIVFLFFLLVFLLGFSLLRGLKRFLFGDGGNQRQQTYQRRTTSQSQNQTYSSRSQNTSSSDSYVNAEEVDNDPPRYRRHRKVYGRDEGEYVDYEEVK
ncbi:DUF4834 family protein [Parabacteroides sp. AD58]|uniref:DUF4834 family protein n=1 Tax=Parabacteroides absconsus TaxID=2951805 RepID=A0ABZ2IHB7_9BACT|nr:DUF4834 family protein [Parabacteroides sp. AD58]MCM6902694.1 DUF4834 family protein [Parabacteroides sp. AD58]